MKPHKPAPKPRRRRKPAAAQANQRRQARRAAKAPQPTPSRTSDEARQPRSSPPIKFDPRPLVMPTRVAQNDDDGDGDPAAPPASSRARAM